MGRGGPAAGVHLDARDADPDGMVEDGMERQTAQTIEYEAKLHKERSFQPV